MPIPKPSSHIDWTDGDISKAVEPSAGKKLLGWVALERPPFEYANWLHFRTDEWSKYFESATDEVLAGNTGYDAVVGGGGTHGSINDAVAAVNPGARIYVKDPQPLIATQTINKNDIEIYFAPDAIFTQPDTLANPLKIDAQRVRVIRPRFVEYDNNIGDIPLLLTVNAKNCIIEVPFFKDNANPTPLVDQGSNNAIISPIEEIA